MHEARLTEPLRARATINGKLVSVLVTHFISNGGYKNRVQTEDGKEYVVLNESLRFMNRLGDSIKKKALERKKT